MVVFKREWQMQNRVLDMACLAIFQSPLMDKSSKPLRGSQFDTWLSLKMKGWAFLELFSPELFSSVSSVLALIKRGSSSAVLIVRRKQMDVHDKDTKVYQCGHMRCYPFRPLHMQGSYHVDTPFGPAWGTKLTTWRHSSSSTAAHTHQRTTWAQWCNH